MNRLINISAGTSFQHRRYQAPNQLSSVTLSELSEAVFEHHGHIQLARLGMGHDALGQAAASVNERQLVKAVIQKPLPRKVEYGVKDGKLLWPVGRYVFFAKGHGTHPLAGGSAVMFSQPPVPADNAR